MGEDDVCLLRLHVVTFCYEEQFYYCYYDDFSIDVMLTLGNDDWLLIILWGHLQNVHHHPTNQSDADHHRH